MAQIDAVLAGWIAPAFCPDCSDDPVIRCRRP